MLSRAVAEAVFTEAVRACDPAARVRAVMPDLVASDRRLGIAVGKAALAMARGAGPVAGGVAITPFDDGGGVPAGWRIVVGPHPVPDERSVAAAEAAWRIAEQATARDVLLVLLSGGASALVEAPRAGLNLGELRATTSAVMAAGASIAELNTVRGALSQIKAGGLVSRCSARVVTLAVSDVVGDDLAVIGSGPTIAPALPLGPRALEILARYGIAVPAVLAGGGTADAPCPPRIGDVARVIAPMRAFADAAVDALLARGFHAERLDPPLAADVEVVADDVEAAAAAVLVPRADDGEVVAANPLPSTDLGGAVVEGLARHAVRQEVSPLRVLVGWGEPTLAVPADHGAGGRAQQLALELARRIRGTSTAAFVAGSDGADGPRPADRPTPAGAYVDGSTWDAIAAAGIDPARALARRDTGTALAAIGALVVTGPTGCNHADLVLVG